MFQRPTTLGELKASLALALKTGRLNKALDLYELIEKQLPDEPRWPHRRGDLLQRVGRKADAVAAYERAVELYTAQGFVARAVAMAKLVVAIDPGRAEVLEQIDPKPARRLHREKRSVIVTAEDAPVTEEDGPPTDTQSLITDALPLIDDHTAASDETKFTKPEQSDDILIDLTDVEILEPKPRASFSSERPTAAYLAQLPSTTLFAEVPRPILNSLARESCLVDVRDQQRLTTAGTSADHLYVLIEGNAEGRRAGDHQSMLLGEGDLAGVAALLSNVGYAEDVVACGRVRALRIDKALLDRLVAEHPPFGDVLFEVLSRRMIATLIRTNPVFTALDDATRRSVARLFEVRRAVRGTRMVEAGKRPDGMYLPLHGRIVARDRAGRRIGPMELGRAVGQDSLLTRELARFTVEAASDVLVLRMPLRQFDTLLRVRPDIVQRFQRMPAPLR